jgi:hypothetical protein
LLPKESDHEGKVQISDKQELNDVFKKFGPDFIENSGKPVSIRIISGRKSEKIPI